MSHHNDVQRVSSPTAHPLVTCRFVKVLQRFPDVFQTVGLAGPAGRVEVAATLTTTEQRSAAVASECVSGSLAACSPSSVLVTHRSETYSQWCKTVSQDALAYLEGLESGRTSLIGLLHCDIPVTQQGDCHSMSLDGCV